MKINVINGVNLNMLGTREPDVYGRLTLDEINAAVADFCAKNGVEVEFFQSNIEGELCQAVQNAQGDGIVINAGAYTHYSIALRDAIKGRGLKTVEVHLTNIFSREDFRRQSVIADVCDGTITGFGLNGYLLAVQSFLL